MRSVSDESEVIIYLWLWMIWFPPFSDPPSAWMASGRCSEQFLLWHCNAHTHQSTIRAIIFNIWKMSNVVWLEFHPGYIWSMNCSCLVNLLLPFLITKSLCMGETWSGLGWIEGWMKDWLQVTERTYDVEYRKAAIVLGQWGERDEWTGRNGVSLDQCIDWLEIFDTIRKNNVCNGVHWTR